MKTPLIFTGLAVAVAFRCGLLNIGAEGQLYVAAFAAAWVGFKFGAQDPGNTAITPFFHLPMIILLPLCCLAAIAAGAIWGGIPGVLKAKFGSHEVINTIMLTSVLGSAFQDNYMGTRADYRRLMARTRRFLPLPMSEKTMAANKARIDAAVAKMSARAFMLFLQYGIFF